MTRALRLARRGYFSTSPNPRVGCVIVNDGHIVGEGWHEVAGGPHAEIIALKNAGENARNADVYITLEPCSHHGRTPPCVNALIKAGVGRVIVAMEDPNPKVAGKGLVGLKQAGIKINLGICAAEARQLNAGFIKRMTVGIPRVTVKIAASLDGRTAMASGESQWITGPAARADVQNIRAAAGAIVTGYGTIKNDDPRLNVRLPGVTRQPLRVVTDSKLRISPNTAILQPPGEAIVVTTSDDLKKRHRLEAVGVSIVRCGKAGGKIDLISLLLELAQREVNDVLVEAGSCLAGAFFKLSLVDEVIIYLAPQFLGTEARGMLQMPGLEKLADRINLVIRDIRQIGPDVRISADIQK